MHRRAADSWSARIARSRSAGVAARLRALAARSSSARCSSAAGRTRSSTLPRSAAAPIASRRSLQLIAAISCRDSSSPDLCPGERRHRDAFGVAAARNAGHQRRQGVCRGSRARSRARLDERAARAAACCAAPTTVPQRRPARISMCSSPMARTPTSARASRHGQAAGRWGFPGCACPAARLRVRR